MYRLFASLFSTLSLPLFHAFRCRSEANNKQLLDEVEQNIVICLWRADQLSSNVRPDGTKGPRR